MIKYFIVPVAAFALIATTASVFAGSFLTTDYSSLGLTDKQVSALEEARTVREEAHDKAEKILSNAGIDQTVMQKIHTAMHDQRKQQHETMQKAIESNDYTAFTDAVNGSPIADTINTKEKFEKFVEMHNAITSGDTDLANTIREELGLPEMMGKMGKDGFGKKGFGMKGIGELSR